MRFTFADGVPSIARGDGVNFSVSAGTATGDGNAASDAVAATDGAVAVVYSPVTTYAFWRGVDYSIRC